MTSTRVLPALRGAARRVWTEPRVPDPPARVWRDWVVVGAFAAGAVAEGLLAPDVPWRPVALALALALVPTLLWRRTHPLGAVLVAFGAIILVDLASFVGGVDRSVGLGTMGYVLVLVYALFRWGSGRDMVLGSAPVLAAYALGMLRDYTTLGDAVFAFVFLCAPALIGFSVRQGVASRARGLERVRAQERELLAWDLHDTVAHHVSAMVVRAQAGRVVAATRPEAADEALAVIEEEGSRTLAEMRALVGALRDGREAELAPQPGLAELRALADPGSPSGDVGVALGSEAAARAGGPGLRVEVTLEGDPAGVGGAVAAAAYRIAQEAVTNARRHARHATAVTVDVRVDDDAVRCSVRDDGEPAVRGRSGYGLVGMQERATLLGGTLTAGPAPEGGWRVEAVLPHRGDAARTHDGRVR